MARHLHISPQAVSQVITGKTRAFTAENSARAARFLAVNSYWLATGHGEARGANLALRESLSDEAIVHAALFERLNHSERQRLRLLILAARESTTTEDTQTLDLPGMSDFAALEEPQHPTRRKGDK